MHKHFSFHVASLVVLVASEVALSLYVIVIIMTLTVTNEVEVKTEADSNDITEHPHDDKPRPHLCTVCDKRFMRSRNTLC